MSTNIFLICDKRSIPKDFKGTAILVDSFDNENCCMSLPYYLENNSARLRSKYLKFIADLGNRKVGGYSITDQLEIGDGLSYWWMTRLAEKSPFKSPNIYKSLLMLALEEILVEFRPNEVRVFSDQSEYAKVIEGICRYKYISYSYESHIFKKPRVFFKTLKPFLSGITSILKRFTLRYRATFFRKTKRYDESKNVTIFSYFTHLSRKHYEMGEHYSFMWTELPNLLMEKGWAINWLQHYLPNGGNVSLSQGLKLLDGFNDKENNNQNHIFLDSHLGLSVLWRTFRSWFRLRRKALSFQNLPALFQVNDSGVNLWPLLKSEWISSTSGSTAATNCFWVALFDSALRDKPRQELGLYLHEGQAWEFAMLTAWRKYKHGKIVSVQHAAAPFWHLYYFNDESVYLNQTSSGMPVPDLWSTNGPAAYNAFLDSGYPSDKVIMLEALRYLNINSNTHEGVSDKSVVGRLKMTIKVLVIGDLSLYQATDKLLLALKYCADVLSKNYQFVYKPHPADISNSCERLGLDIKLTDAPLAEIVSNFDIAISGHGTSGGLDAYLAGIKSIVFLDSTSFNLSPLRGLDSVQFVSSPLELTDALTSLATLNNKNDIAADFFLSDSRLRRWAAFT